MSNKINLIVIGAGPGGYAAAFLASDLGMNVTVVDMEKKPRWSMSISRLYSL